MEQRRASWAEERRPTEGGIKKAPVSVPFLFPVTPVPPVRSPPRSVPCSPPFPTPCYCPWQVVLSSAILPAFSGGLKVAVLASHGT